MRSAKLATVTSMIMFLCVSACSDGKNCEPRAGTYCVEDVAYWVDSCGEIEELIEQCTCGCTAEHDGCRPCDCPGGAAHGDQESRQCYPAASVPATETCQAEQQTRTCNNGSWDPDWPECEHLSCTVCGNANLDSGETCDDGDNDTETECPYGTATCSLCSADCSQELDLSGRTCGDGTNDAEEACDDGNTVSETECSYGTQTCTACSADCGTELNLTGGYCGDGVNDFQETCDGDCPTSCESNDPCLEGTLNGSAENCDAYCGYTSIDQCSNGDGCCPEQCLRGEDDDCSTWWSMQIGGAGGDYGIDVALDGSGNILATGHFVETVDFGDGPQTSNGESDIFVIKFDPDGTHLWSRTYGAGSADDAGGIEVDGSGNVLLTGGFKTSINFGGGDLMVPTDPVVCLAYADIYLAKLDPDGIHLDSQSFGGCNWDMGYGITSDAQGNMLITGHFRNAADFGGGQLDATGNAMFVAKYTPDGDHMSSFKQTGCIRGKGIATDASMNILAGGQFDRLTKYDPGGVVIWEMQLAGNGEANVETIVVDDSGDILIAGDFDGTVDFGDGPQDAVGGVDIYLARYDSDGNHIWSRVIGGADDDVASAIALDDSGDLVLAGVFKETVDFGGQPLTSAGDFDGFLAKYDSDGVHLTSQRYGGIGYDSIRGLAVDGAGQAVMIGLFEGSIDLGGSQMTSNGSYDVFLLKLDTTVPF